MSPASSAERQAAPASAHAATTKRSVSRPASLRNTGRGPSVPSTGHPADGSKKLIAYISAALTVTPTIVNDLRGLDHGDADGRPWHEFKTAFAGPPHHRPDEPYARGAEPWNQYLDRATAALRRILHDHAGERILIAAHGETIEAAHVLLLQLPAEVRLGLGFVTDHTGITRWQQHINRFERETWMLAAHNDTAHLNEFRL